MFSVASKKSQNLEARPKLPDPNEIVNDIVNCDQSDILFRLFGSETGGS